MGLGGEAIRKGTSEVIGKTGDKQQTSMETETTGTAGVMPLLRLHSGTETFQVKETGDAASPVTLVPETSSQRQEIRGKTLAAWGLDRRIAARELMDMWQEAASHIDSDGFAVYVEAVISKAEEYMSQFRDIPNEDAFSGVVQLVRDVISGPNFELIQKEGLDGYITDVLLSLRQHTITMGTYRAAHNTLYGLGLLQKA